MSNERPFNPRFAQGALLATLMKTRRAIDQLTSRKLGISYAYSAVDHLDGCIAGYEANAGTFSPYRVHPRVVDLAAFREKRYGHAHG